VNFFSERIISMHKALSGKQTETDRTQETPEQKPTNPKQTIQRAIDPSRLPLYAKAWGNRPPPGLRLTDPEQVSHEEGPLQRQAEPLQRKENNTGLPDALKAGVEGLSGMAMDDVQVHYNSPKPAEVQALAYTQGAEIHVGPGQEQHLAHETWHVVQQKQGRVQATMQMKGVAINDDEGLEREADVMGYKTIMGQSVKEPLDQFAEPSSKGQTIQRYPYINSDPPDRKDAQIYGIYQTNKGIIDNLLYIGQTTDDRAGIRFIEHVTNDKHAPWYYQNGIDYTVEEKKWPFVPRQLDRLKNVTKFETTAAEQSWMEHYGGTGKLKYNYNNAMTKKLFINIKIY
jgi:hypothetical protein